MTRSPRFMFGLLALAVLAVGSAPRNTIAGTDSDALSLSDLMSIEIVTASKEAEPINKAPGVVSTLSRDEIDRLGPRSLIQVLATMPGIVVSGSYLFDRASLAVQGDMSKESSSHLLLLINGRPIREVQQGGLSEEILRGFPTSTIERIELIKGSGSVLYGSDAFTGVINIITRKPAENRTKATLMTSSEWARRGDVALSMVQGDLSISQSATYDKNERMDATYVYRNRSTGATADLPIRYAPTSYGGHTQIEFRDFTAMLGYAQSTNFSQLRGLVNHTSQEKTYANIGYDHVVNDWWSISVNSGITQAELKTDAFPNIVRNSYEAMGEMTNFLKVGEGKVVVGGLFTHRQGEEKNWLSGVVQGEDGFNGVSAYSQVGYPVIQPVQLIGGVQYNQMFGLKAAFAPRAGAIWEINRKISLKALWSNAYRAPSINELSLDAATIKGNGDLAAENIQTYDLALSYSGNNIYSSGNIFYSKMSDIIKALPTSTIVPGFGPLLKYRNADNILIMGAGLEAKGYITAAWLVSGSFNYQESFNDDDAWGLLPIPDYSGKLGASYVSPKGWDAGISNIFLGAYPEKFTTGLVNPAPERAVLTDLNAKVSLSKLFGQEGKQDLALRAQVRNLFDESGTTPEWGGTTKDALPNLTGRSYCAGMELRF